jgi:hypothetical protein
MNNHNHNTHYLTPGSSRHYKKRALEAMQALRQIKNPLLMTEYYKLMLTQLRYIKKKRN